MLCPLQYKSTVAQVIMLTCNDKKTVVALAKKLILY